jgi:putative PIN family toxin of toxin-antitoxin system
LVDANIIISAGLFPDSPVGEVLKHIVQNHNLLLCQYTLDELTDVFERKFKNRIEYLNEFVRDLKYELVNTEINNYRKYPQIRDKDDMPLLVSALESNVDVLVTGDKDFEEIIIKKPKIMKPRNYIEKYMKKK